MDVIQKKRPKRKALMKMFLNTTFVGNRIIHVASSDREAADIRAAVGKRAKVVVISHFICSFRENAAYHEKKTELLQVAFVGRITEQKNLKFALRAVKEAGSGITLHIFGPIDDQTYYRECTQYASANDLTDRLVFYGNIEKSELLERIFCMDIFFLPTKGENFGQSIIEALQMGLPVLISSQTPWLGLEERGAGWAFSLGRRDAFVDVLKTARQAGAEWGLRRKKAREYVEGLREELNMVSRENWHKLVKENI